MDSWCGGQWADAYVLQGGTGMRRRTVHPSLCKSNLATSYPSTKDNMKLTDKLALTICVMVAWIVLLYYLWRKRWRNGARFVVRTHGSSTTAVHPVRVKSALLQARSATSRAVPKRTNSLLGGVRWRLDSVGRVWAVTFVAVTTRLTWRTRSRSTRASARGVSGFYSCRGASPSA
jgi:hypothetical protein